MLLNEYAAHHYLIGVVRKNERLSDYPLFLNKGRHVLLRTQKGNNYYCVYHRDFFLTFAQQFELYVSTFPEHNDVGESINLECLEDAEKRGAETLLFIHANGNIYKVYTAFVRKYCLETHHLVRTQLRANKYAAGNYSTDKVEVHEKTVSIPKALLEKYDFF